MFRVCYHTRRRVFQNYGVGSTEKHVATTASNWLLHYKLKSKYFPRLRDSNNIKEPTDCEIIWRKFFITTSQPDRNNLFLEKEMNLQNYGQHTFLLAPVVNVRLNGPCYENQLIWKLLGKEITNGCLNETWKPNETI